MEATGKPARTFLSLALILALVSSFFVFPAVMGAYATDSPTEAPVISQHTVSAKNAQGNVKVTALEVSQIAVSKDLPLTVAGAFVLSSQPTSDETGEGAANATCTVTVNLEGIDQDVAEALRAFSLSQNEQGEYALESEEIDSNLDDQGMLTFEAKADQAFAIAIPVTDDDDALADGEGDAMKSSSSLKRSDVSLLADGDIRAEPATVKGVDSRSEVGLQINLFDYSGTNPDLDGNFYIDSSYSAGMTGINVNNGSLRPFRFFTGGTAPSGVSETNPPADGTCNINNYTGGSKTVNQGIVQNKLVNGYPVLNSSAGGSSLDYLFDESSVNGKTAYRGLTGLFQQDSDGYYYYDSNKNYAYYGSGQPNSEFKLYSTTFDKSGSTNYKIGYFPFDQYAKTDDQVGPTHKNHQFGMTISGDFVYPPNGTINRNNTSKDMTFEFSGDDDVWVFVDGVLVLDLGGIHQPAAGKINFATGEVTVEGATKCSGAGTTAGTSNTLANIFAAAGKTWDNTSYSAHHMDFFYLERGGYDSNCAISMNLVLTRTFNMNVEKAWSDGAAAHTSDSLAVQLYCHDAAGAKTAYGSPVVLNAANNWKTTFNNLPATDDNGNAYTFTVEEGTVDDKGVFTKSEKMTGANGSDYKLTSTTYTNNNTAVTSGFQVADTSDPADGTMKLTNTKQIPPTELVIFKEDATTKAPLSNVSFELRADSNNNGTLDASDALATAYSDAACTTPITAAVATGADGKAHFYGLKPGVYWIKETKAQSGYQKLDAPIRFEINADATQAYFHDSKTQVAIADKSVSITVDNTKIQSLPTAGGTDKGLLLLLGTFTIVVSAFCLAWRKNAAQ